MIHKTIIFCDNSEIEDLKVLLVLKGINASVISEELSEGVQHLEQIWTRCKGGKYLGVYVLLTYMASFAITINLFLFQCWYVLITYSVPCYLLHVQRY